jgi:hypothetical protein
MAKTVSQEGHRNLCQVYTIEPFQESTLSGTYRNIYCTGCGLRLFSSKMKEEARWRA